MRFNGKGKRVAVAAGALLVTVAIGGTVISRAFAGGVDVPTAKVSRETLSVTVSVSGKTEADRKADVFPPAAGTLLSVKVAEGQEVKAGDIIAEMDADQLDAAVDAAENAYDGAASQLEAIDAQVPSATEREAADAQVKAAKRQYEQAADAYDAAKAARSGEATIAAARTAKEQAYAAYMGAKGAQQRLRTAGDVDSRRKAARTGRDSARRNLDRAEADRDRATLRAPIDGVVLFNAIGAPGPDGNAPKATDGAAVAPGSAPFTVVDLSTLKFTGQLDENDVARVKVGAAGVVTLDAQPGKDVETKIASIKPTATQTANGAVVFPVGLVIPNPAGALRLGMSGSAVISVEDVKDAVAVPIEALVDDKDGEYVFVVEDGKLVKREVKTGVMTETHVEIVKGLKGAETVALTSGVTLAEGMAVKTGGKR